MFLMARSTLPFFYSCLLLTVNKYSIKIGNGWIWTNYLGFWNRPPGQLCHNQCPTDLFVVQLNCIYPWTLFWLKDTFQITIPGTVGATLISMSICRYTHWMRIRHGRISTSNASSKPFTTTPKKFFQAIFLLTWKTLKRPSTAWTIAERKTTI